MNSEEDRSMDGNTTLAPREEHQGFFQELWQQARLVYRLFRDPEVPIYLKLLPVAATAYLLFPFDFLPDVIPGLGQLDDITILVVGAKMFIELAPQHVVERYIQEMRSGGFVSSSIDDESTNEHFNADPDVIEGIIVEEDSVVDSSKDDEQGD